MLSSVPMLKRGSSRSIAASTPYQPPRIAACRNVPPRLSNSRSRAHILQATCLWLKALEILASGCFGHDARQPADQPAAGVGGDAAREIERAVAPIGVPTVRLGSICHFRVVSSTRQGCNKTRWQHELDDARRGRADARFPGQHPSPFRSRRRDPPGPGGAFRARLPAYRGDRRPSAAGHRLSDARAAFRAFGRPEDPAAGSRRAARPAVQGPPCVAQVPGGRVRLCADELRRWCCSAIR